MKEKTALESVEAQTQKEGLELVATGNQLNLVRRSTTQRWLMQSRYCGSLSLFRQNVLKLSNYGLLG